ncbi:phosphoserine phosphatase [Sorangium cellulosum]|uniref:Phosphoserine phosphatase n=1 Tax=Sorangium cellulosum TaxID=56 RepID=A0A4P2Q4P2_SORCE|nr:substrate-binding domain-containing protein [Sorangium cellulosum]AUX24340.1 phosphoserine phosphatase [Sorangium cellulosum]
MSRARGARGVADSSGRVRPTIALLMNNVVGDYQSEVRAGVERAAQAQDVNLLIAFAFGELLAPGGKEGAAWNDLYRLIGAEMVDGIIIASSTLCHHVGIEATRAFCRSYAPLPVCSIGMAVEGVPSLMIDNALGSELSVAHMADDHGRRRIAYISGPANNEEAQLRARAHREALAARSIPLDERLFAFGEFSIDSGRRAMSEILSRGAELDAVAAANDRMALGAIEQLKAQGLRVPEDVLVCGFDDVGVARFAKPSLTTVRQPTKRLGELALETVVRMVAGEAAPELRLVEVDLTRRESCGCGHEGRASRGPSDLAGPRGPRSSAGARAALELSLKRAVTVPAGSLEGWAGALLSALEAELAGEAGRFLRALEALLDVARREGVLLEQFQAVISLLRAALYRPIEREGDAAVNEALEPIWHAARILVGSASVHAEGEQRLRVELASVELSYGSRGFSTCLSLPVLRSMLAEELPRMQFSRVAVSLFDNPQRTMMRSFFLMEEGREVEPPPARFPARHLAPPGFLRGVGRWSAIAFPVASGEVEKFGVAVLDSRANEMIYDALRLQLGAAMQGAALHREVVRQVELRERLEQEKVREESRVAARIQTSLVPERLDVEGLELGAIMKPAAEVGGDYYDVIATPGGGWLGIGGVAGRGLAAGLILLMIQSMVSVMARSGLAESPRGILIALNAAVYKNVRTRMERDEHATLLLLRYERGGRVTFAGAHEGLLVCSARTGRCARIPSAGALIGARPAIDALTRDDELVLEDGDVLVLYSDGVTEARDAQGEPFGPARLCAAIEAAQAAPVDVIRDRILGEIEGWRSSPDDDITLVVARYRAPA